ncbi:MAG: dicarboxylate/amino acid:cation symporter [Verrucomicrobiales bacterium]
MTGLAPAAPDSPPSSKKPIPFVLWIIMALGLGLAAGLGLHHGADPAISARVAIWLKEVAGFVLGLLRLLATPLIFTAILMALVKAEVSGRSGARLLWFISTNTLVAILIGLVVANTIRPGIGADLPAPKAADTAALAAKPVFDPWRDFVLKSIPKNLIDPFRENDMIGVILLALVLGAGLRTLRTRGGRPAEHVASLVSAAETVFELLLVLLHWLFKAVPVAVFAVVAAVVASKGLSPLLAMGWFVLAVLVALLLQAGFYLLRLRRGSWVRPGHFLKGASEALAVAFSTASSTATLPVTYRCAVQKLGVRPANASLGVMVGGSMNNDGTALYEAVAALFIAQAIGQHLGPGAQILLIFMAVIASVGAAGIPEAGLITMIAVFTAVKLPVEYIPLLLTVDWFLDRCRTAINVMGDLAVTSLLDGRERAGPQ